MLYFYLGFFGFVCFSVPLMCLYMYSIGKIQNRYSKPVYILISAILYGAMVISILIGATISVWLGEKLNIYTGSGDMLYFSGFLTFVLSYEL